MTTTEEMLRAIDSAHAFLFDLMNPQSTKRIPKEIRQRARRVVKHFPFSSDYMLQCLSSDQFASENICEELKDRCEHLETDRNNLAASTEAMQEKLSKVIEERDEARREVCGFHHLTGFLAGDYANSRGWDYLNDDRHWPEFPQSVTDFKLFLEGQDKIFLEMNNRLRNDNKQLLKAMVLVETITKDISVLSTRPADIIKRSELVDLINDWGDTARSIKNSVYKIDNNEQ